MVVYTLEQRWEILRHYFENHGNVAECVRKLRTDFGRREAPSAPYVRYLVKKVKETGILIDKPNREKPKTVRTPENIDCVAESVREAPSTSIHCRSQQLNISETSLRRILHKDLGDIMAPKRGEENRVRSIMAERPKRPLSAYMLWLNENREKIKKENPGGKVTEIAKRGGELWRAMKDKSEWEAKAAKQKDEYTKAVKEFEANGGVNAGNKRKTKQTKAPAKKAKKKKDTSEEESGGDESD